MFLKTKEFSQGHYLLIHIINISFVKMPGWCCKRGVGFEQTQPKRTGSLYYCYSFLSPSTFAQYSLLCWTFNNQNSWLRKCQNSSSSFLFVCPSVCFLHMHQHKARTVVYSIPCSIFPLARTNIIFSDTPHPSLSFLSALPFQLIKIYSHNLRLLSSGSERLIGNFSSGKKKKEKRKT